MDKLNDDYQLKYAGLVLRDVARSGSAERCAQVVGTACDIIRSAQKNPNITQADRNVLDYARMYVNHARKSISGSGKGGAS